MRRSTPSRARKTPAGRTRVGFHWSDGAGSEVTKTFEFRAKEPMVGVEVTAIDRGRTVTPRLTWGPGFEVEDPKHRSNTYYNGQAVIYDGTVVTRFAKRKIDQPIAIPESGASRMGRPRGPVLHRALSARGCPRRARRSLRFRRARSRPRGKSFRTTSSRAP